MEITVNRAWKREGYTIGTLSIDGKRLGDGKHYCCTLEDTDRGLAQDMTLNKILFLKKPHVTAIPRGRYEVMMTYSPRFKRYLPLVNDVPGYSGVRIHAGNSAEDTDGCILVGENTAKGKVLNSRHWLAIVVGRINEAVAKKERVWMTIK